MSTSYQKTVKKSISPKAYKYKQKILVSLTIIAMLFLLLGTVGCNFSAAFAWYEGSNEHDHLPTVMNAGETLTITRSHFDHLDIDFNRFEIWVHSENGERILRSGCARPTSTVVSIRGNTITAGHSGHVMIAATLIGRENGLRRERNVWVTSLHVINEAIMTHITTPQELADINNNLDGHFILMADIDLADFGEWVPIGRSESMFSGMLVNPHGYVIENLTITTSKTDTTMRGTLSEIGLFGIIIDKAFIYGIILEDIYINVSDFEGEAIGSPDIGGIAGFSNRGARIVNSQVSGTLVGAGFRTGGIVGGNFAFITGSVFEGKIVGPVSFSDHTVSVGGIAGGHAVLYDGYLFNNRVYATIIGNFANAGGIVGFNHIGLPTNNFFYGSISGRNVGEIIGYDNGRHFTTR